MNCFFSFSKKQRQKIRNSPSAPVLHNYSKPLFMKYTFTRIFCSFVLFICLLSALAQPIISYDNFISSGLSSPIEIVNAGDGSDRLFIVEKEGVIKVWVSGSTVLSTPFLTIPSITLSLGGEQGLLSMAFHPDYEDNGFFYVYYTRSGDGAIVIARYHNPTPADNVAEGAATVLLVIPHPGASNHNGGHLQFRPEGGINYLYFATGDGGSANDPGNNAQNDGSSLGKMIRMNVDFLPLPITPQIFAKGLRNPFRWSFDRSTGDMWIGDVGQGIKEEVSFWPAASGAGANFGWRCFEGTEQNGSVPTCVPTGHILPVFEYDNPPGPPPSAVTGGYVYRGSNTSFVGYYITTDFYSGQVWILNSDGSVARTQTNLAPFIAAYGEDEDGELYAVSISGNAVYRVSASSTAPLPITLINFSAKQFSGFNEIRWSTSFEQNADRYIIEFSTDGRIFNSVGDVQARNASSGHNYSFRHNIADTRKLFYRLQMLDQDGSARYSAIVAIGGNDKGNVAIYPTVLQNNTMEMIGNISLDKLSVFNANGKEVYRSNLNGRQGYFSIQLPNLARGIYFVAIQGKDYNKTERVIIQ
jgi:glucose/arabinose dehydrogenase